MLDPSLFASSPARDDRFTVVDRWVECVNLPVDNPQHRIEFFHRQMNEEINSLESSAQTLCDFPDADWELRMQLARQCADESRHTIMFRRILEKYGGHVGQYPVLNFQFRIITNIDSLIGRLTVQNRSFEAGGLDAIAFGLKEARSQDQLEIVDLYESQLADEISHVRFANEWIYNSVKKSPRNLLKIGAALTTAETAFFQVMGSEGTEGVKYPADWKGRLEAGFTPEEIRAADQTASMS